MTENGDVATFRKGTIVRNLGSKIAKLFVALVAAAPIAAAAAADLPIYIDSLSAGWADWSWSATRNLANASPVHGAPSSLAVTVTAAWGALYLHADTAIALTGYSQLRFWVNGGNAGGQQLVLVMNNGAQSFPFTAPANTWTQVSVPLSATSPTSLTDLYWQDAANSAQPTFYLDDIVLVAGAGSGGVQTPIAGPALTVDAGAGHHAISADIYGVNFLDETLAAELRLPVRRRGGNSTTRYNWQNDTYNTGSDWYFENIPEDNPNPASLPDGSAADRFVEQDRRTATRTLMTVPMSGWVAKRRLAGHPYDCGFKVSKYGAQQSTDQWDPDCGNGTAGNGKAIVGNDPTDTSVAIGASFVGNWVTHLVGKYGTAANGGVAYYDLDNEPSLWNSTHRDVHPQPTTYDEMRDRSYQYAAAVKAVDPSARTLGPVEWGWCSYLYSAADPGGCSAGADYQAHGSVPFVAWYLQQMHSYEQQHAVRILDYLDLHYYPAANGVSLSTAGDAATQALRLRSTRSLWDPAYIDESWISTMVDGGVAVKMIPRMKSWVADNYPGTRLAITEYNWGGLESMNGALAQADVLGIFGREGLDLATLWAPPTTSEPGAFAFRMYRNYDGAGHGFGETAVQSASADQDSLAVYAAQRSADGALTVMVINKSADTLTSSIGLANFSPRSAASVYRYSPANPAAIEHAADQPVTAGGFTATFPAGSISLFVVPAAGNTGGCASQPAGCIPPRNGLWAVAAEVNGQPGRGFQIEVQHGVLVATIYAYDSSGKGIFYLASGSLTGNVFSAPLTYYRDGIAFGGPTRSAVTAGTAGSLAMTFTDSTHGTITFPGEVAKSIAKFDWANPVIANAGDPTGGLWAITSEVNGQPGRGFQFEVQNGVLVTTVYGYDAAGNGTFYLASGALSDGTFSGPLAYYSGGTSFGGSFHAAVQAGIAGPVSITFTDSSHGTIAFPGEAAKSIGKFNW